MLTVRPWILAISCIVAALVAATVGRAMAESPTASVHGKILQMQTAFNPDLPGAGEGVRTFTKSIRHMSGGTWSSRSSSPAAWRRRRTCWTR